MSAHLFQILFITKRLDWVLWAGWVFWVAFGSLFLGFEGLDNFWRVFVFSKDGLCYHSLSSERMTSGYCRKQIFVRKQAC